jgi:uncharacterized C2H2 Zn-finger protein
MADDMIQIKCPKCDNLFGVSLNTFDHVDEVKLRCVNDNKEHDELFLSVTYNKKGKSLAVEIISYESFCR